ncbi:heavy-metal-associated domain-containing protein [Mongoliitalea lutea]|uniref:Uncharacterized protein n=1 Tax=Mongoliitalea lutea TaxID=849756 RepID=A0A8J3CZN6_9BACT|nr:heavy-metal-associated domain-containing protein [Mongoliitalea lutea]GHB49680.1 hypothetical protein GCM10008106_33060 [Mongoliitalea lutea]
MDKIMVKRIIIGLIAIFLFLIATLAVHIYLVTKPSPGAISSISMGRIDFNKSIDSLETLAIVQKAKSLEGVQDIRVNVESGFLICLYDRKKWSGDDLSNWISEEFNMSASFFRPTDEMLSQSCPAIDKNSLTFKLGDFFQKTFEKIH